MERPKRRRCPQKEIVVINMGEYGCPMCLGYCYHKYSETDGECCIGCCHCQKAHLERISENK